MLVLVNKMKRTCHLVAFAVLADHSVKGERKNLINIGTLFLVEYKDDSDSKGLWNDLIEPERDLK